jgi:hypothetical protein
MAKVLRRQPLSGQHVVPHLAGLRASHGRPVIH